MPEIEDVVSRALTAPSWDRRVALIRTLPETFGLSQQPAVYAAIARAVYVPNLVPDFAYVYWRDDYQLGTIEAAYARAYELTSGFHEVSVERLILALRSAPQTLRIFRLLLGLLPQEFSAATSFLDGELNLQQVSSTRVKSIEQGNRMSESMAQCCTEVITRVMEGRLFPAPGPGSSPKIAKPDTANGWASVREYAENGVLLPMLLHQRHYGGAFRQLLDATSATRGDLLENAVEGLLAVGGVLFIRTGSKNQREIETRFALTVRPAPDFVIFDAAGTLRAILECKAANDGGIARDKAARYRSLRQEGNRLGVPLFAVLAGLGWKRTADALGPVVRDTDGRVFMLGTLGDILSTSPFPTLVNAAR